MKIQYTNEFVQNFGVGDPISCIYQFIYDESDNDDTKIKDILLCMYWDYVSRYIVMWHTCSMNFYSVIINYLLYI